MKNCYNFPGFPVDNAVKNVIVYFQVRLKTYLNTNLSGGVAGEPGFPANEVIV